jgi:hypothetical protein
MNATVEVIWKEAVLSQLNCFPGICRRKETHEHISEQTVSLLRFEPKTPPPPATTAATATYYYYYCHTTLLGSNALSSESQQMFRWNVLRPS